MSVRIVVYGHPRAIHGIDVKSDRGAFLGDGSLADFLTEPMGIGQSFRSIEFAAVGSADEFLHLPKIIRAGDEGALMDMVMPADVIFYTVLLKAHEERILHVRIGIGITLEQAVLVAFTDEVMMGEDKGMVGAPVGFFQSAGDPVLLTGNRPPVIIARSDENLSRMISTGGESP